SSLRPPLLMPIKGSHSSVPLNLPSCFKHPNRLSSRAFGGGFSSPTVTMKQTKSPVDLFLTAKPSSRSSGLGKKSMESPSLFNTFVFNPRGNRPLPTERKIAAPAGPESRSTKIRPDHRLVWRRFFFPPTPPRGRPPPPPANANADGSPAGNCR